MSASTDVTHFKKSISADVHGNDKGKVATVLFFN
jgi:hypothetical protein